MNEPTYTPIDVGQPVRREYRLRPVSEYALGLLTALIIVSIVIDFYRIAVTHRVYSDVKKLEALVEKLEVKQP